MYFTKRGLALTLLPILSSLRFCQQQSVELSRSLAFCHKKWTRILFLSNGLIGEVAKLSSTAANFIVMIEVPSKVPVALRLT
jgi:hypothetical protein